MLELPRTALRTRGDEPPSLGLLMGMTEAEDS